MDPAVHDATARDGTRLAWTSAGAGSPAVVLTDGIGCAGYVWRALPPELARQRRVLHWNYRAHGASGAPADPERMEIQDCVSDLVAVLDAAGERRAIVAGHSMGVQVALELHRRAPERVAGLVLLCGAPGRLLDSFHDSSTLRILFPVLRRMVLRWPELARRAFRAVVPTEIALEYALAYEVDASRVLREDLARYLDDLARVDPALFVRLLASAAEHDATPHLPAVDVPTLVVAGERDGFTPIRLSMRMHRVIPASELLVVPGGTHVAPLEAPALVAARVLEFLAARVPPARAGEAIPPARPARRRAAPRRAATGAARPGKPGARRRRPPRDDG
jgi:pimeloyl-ACP methyl ester carboxylesterase